MKKMLVVYYSWSCGNTEAVAEQLAQATGAELVRLETCEPYPEDYDETVEQGKREVERGYRPDIEELGASVADYDVVAVGTPTWWYTMAPAVATFLSENAVALADKVVVPFSTNGGWAGTVIEDIEDACPDAAFACPLEVQFDSTGGSDLVTPQRTIDAWIADVKALLS